MCAVKIVTWNCKGAFGRKHASVVTLDPDVLVIPEAEKLGTLSNIVGAKPIQSFEWFGDNTKKGLAVVSYGNYSLKVHEAYDPRHRWVVPIRVDGPVTFTLFAVWTVPHLDTRYYAQCLFEALDAYRPIFSSPPVVVAGDFNDNVDFDGRMSEPLLFSDLLQQFETYGLRSLYHMHGECPHGGEADKTFFLYHHADKGHHLDYIFATPDLYARGFDFMIGDHAAWSKLSDHMPLSCSFFTPSPD